VGSFLEGLAIRSDGFLEPLAFDSWRTPGVVTVHCSLRDLRQEARKRSARASGRRHPCAPGALGTTPAKLISLLRCHRTPRSREIMKGLAPSTPGLPAPAKSVARQRMRAISPNSCRLNPAAWERSRLLVGALRGSRRVQWYPSLRSTADEGGTPSRHPASSPVPYHMRAEPAHAPHVEFQSPIAQWIRWAWRSSGAGGRTGSGGSPEHAKSCAA
jgi:hypothetical protein